MWTILLYFKKIKIYVHIQRLSAVKKVKIKNSSYNNLKSYEYISVIYKYYFYYNYAGYKIIQYYYKWYLFETKKKKQKNHINIVIFG